VSQTWGANHSLVFGVLPVAQFASGHTFFVQRLFELQKVKPYVVHTTFQVRLARGNRRRQAVARGSAPGRAWMGMGNGGFKIQLVPGQGWLVHCHTQ
jgi:hypothetical protein